jgi:hypothetical protein
MPRREFRLHRPCARAVDFTRINRKALTRPRNSRCRRLPSIFCDNGKWLNFKAEVEGADLIGLVAHAINITQRDAARTRGLLSDNVIASVRPGTRRRRGEGRTLFHGGTRSATRPDGDDRSTATISPSARLQIHEKAGADPAGGSCGRPNRISVQAEGRHQ